MLTVWLLTAPARADWPLGTEIPGALTADVTPEGLDAITGVIPALVPPMVVIPDIHQGDSQGGGWCGCFCEYGYSLDLTNGKVYVSVNSIDIEPGTGVLNLTASVNIAVNDAADPLYLDVGGTAVCIDINEACDGHVDPFNINLDAAIQLTLLPDGTVDAYVPPPGWTWSLDADDIVLSDCVVGDIVDVLDFFGIEPYDLIIDQIETQIDGVVADLGPTIETALEGAFASVGAISGEVDLLGAPLAYTLTPSELTIVPEGVRIGMTGAFDTTPAPCVAQYGITESLATTGTPPAVGTWPTTIGYTPHLAINADDDLINQALFAVWESGILCQTIDSDSADSLGLPIGIDTGLLDLLAPGVYDTLFPATAPMVIALSPKLPPVASPQGPNDVNLAIDGLGIDLMAGLDGRMIRVVGLDLAADAGADLNFDDATGLLAVAVALGDDAISATVGFNELTPDANATIVDAFQNLFNSLVGPILTSALGDLSFPMPAFLGYGVTTLDVEPTGNLDLDPSGGQGDQLGLYATIGPVAYTATGCSCSDPTATGCDTSAGRGISALGMLAAAFVARRRRSLDA
jgi:hypothetical protein